MGVIISVSIRTVRMRLADCGLSILCDQYADVTDHELEHLVTGIKMQFPTFGENKMMGYRTFGMFCTSVSNAIL